MIVEGMFMGILQIDAGGLELSSCWLCLGVHSKRQITIPHSVELN